jgi:hypothetical protein
MPIVIDDAATEQIAERLATIRGKSVADVVRESLLALPGAVQHYPEHPEIPLRERLESLMKEINAIPRREPPDTRTDDEILGYNEYGVWS